MVYIILVGYCIKGNFMYKFLLTLSFCFLESGNEQKKNDSHKVTSHSFLPSVPKS